MRMRYNSIDVKDSTEKYRIRVRMLLTTQNPGVNTWNEAKSHDSKNEAKSHNSTVLCGRNSIVQKCSFRHAFDRLCSTAPAP